MLYILNQLKLIAIYTTVLLCCLICSGCITTNYKGTSTYTKSSDEKLNTNFTIEYKIPMYETSNKNLSYSINGKVHTDYDVFNNELCTVTFTTIGVDF